MFYIQLPSEVLLLFSGPRPTLPPFPPGRVPGVLQSLAQVRGGAVVVRGEGAPGAAPPVGG